MDPQEKLRQALAAFIEVSKASTPNFSMRSLARMINVPPGNLSQFLAGKRKFSPATVESIVREITTNPEERKDLLEEINHLRLEELRKLAPSSKTSQYEFTTLTDEEFTTLDEWYYYAVRTVLSLANPRFEVDWIAEKLNISSAKAEKALKVLFRLKLIELSPDGRIVRTQKHLKTPDSVKKNVKINETKTKIHRQHILHSLESLEKVDPSKRDITWVNIPANSSKLDQAREIIRKCQDDLLALLEDEATDEILRLTIQLCPIGAGTGGDRP